MSFRMLTCFLLFAVLTLTSIVQPVNVDSETCQTPVLIFSENFDDGDISDWTVTATGDALFEVSTDKSVSLPYSVHMKSLADSRAIGDSPLYSLDLTRDYNVSLEFLIPHTNNHWFEVFNNHQIYLLIDYGGDLKCYNGASAQLVMTLGTNQWYLIEIKAYPSSNSYDVFVNGSLKKTCPMWIHGGLEDNFRIGDRAEGSTDRGEAFWDDVNIYQCTSIHDLAVLHLWNSKTVVGQGYSANIAVLVENQGDFAENFNVTLWCNGTAMEKKEETIGNGDSSNVTFIFNTAELAKGNYTLKATIDILQGETDTADNNYTNGWIIVSMLGDLTGPEDQPDGKCDIRDVAMVAKLFGANYPHPRYDANCDLTGPTTGIPDGKIDIRDVATIASHFGKIDPQHA